MLVSSGYLKKSVCIFLCILFNSFILAQDLSSEILAQDSAQEESHLLQNEEEEEEEGSGATTTEDPLAEVTAIPDTVIHDILNLDLGKYTNQKFTYFNLQNFHLPWKREQWHAGRCYNDYMRCTLTLSTHYVVCGLNDRWHDAGMIDMPSYCELFLDNCRRGKRYWIAFKKGPCHWKKDDDKHYWTTIGWD